MPTPAPASNLYVTLQSAYMSYPPGGATFAGAAGVSRFYPLSVSAGYWIGSKTHKGQRAQRLAIEFNYTAQPTRTETVETGYERTTSRTSSRAFTLLERAVIPPLSASGRWGVEAALGLTWYKATQRSESVVLSTGDALGARRQGSSSLQLVAGLSPFYQATPHWQLLADLRMQGAFIFSTDGHRLGGGVALGTRYYF